MGCKTPFFLAAAVVAAASLVTGMGRGRGPGSRSAGGSVAPGDGDSGDSQYISPTAGDPGAAVGASLSDNKGPDKPYLDGRPTRPGSEGSPDNVPGRGDLKPAGGGGTSTDVSYSGEARPVGFPKYKNTSNIDVIGAEVTPGLRRPTPRARTPKGEKSLELKAVGAEVIPGAATQRKTVPALGPKDKKSCSTHDVGTEVIPGSISECDKNTFAHTAKHGKLTRLDVLGSEVIPPGATESSNKTSLTKPLEPVLANPVKAGGLLNVTGSEVIPSNVIGTNITTPVKAAKYSKINPVKAAGILNVTGSEVIPAGAIDNNQTSLTKAPALVPVTDVKTAGLLNVTGSEVIPATATERNITSPVTEAKSLKVNPVSGPKTEQAKSVKVPKQEQVNPYVGPRPQRVPMNTALKPPQGLAVKTPRETKPPRDKVSKHKATATKGRRGPCKEGLGKNFCSFQYRPGGRRHLMTPEVLQRYLKTGWAPVTTPTNETMHVCCDGKTQMIGFVGRDRKGGGAGGVAKGNTERIMNKEVKKLKKKIEKIHKNDESTEQ